MKELIKERLKIARDQRNHCECKEGFEASNAWRYFNGKVAAFEELLRIIGRE